MGATKNVSVKKGHASSTPGKLKGANCQKTPLKRMYANDSRLHKTNPKLFLAACDEVNKIQVQSGESKLAEFQVKQ